MFANSAKIGERNLKIKMFMRLGWSYLALENYTKAIEFLVRLSFEHWLVAPLTIAGVLFCIVFTTLLLLVAVLGVSLCIIIIFATLLLQGMRSIKRHA
jgi:hypothetical protein